MITSTWSLTVPLSGVSSSELEVVVMVDEIEEVDEIEGDENATVGDLGPGVVVPHFTSWIIFIRAGNGEKHTHRGRRGRWGER